MSLTKATYSMIYGAVVNILDKGADPTGLTDSTAAIQSAIDSGAGTIFYPDGTYSVDGVSIKSNQIHLGSGAAILTTATDAFIPVGNSSNVVIDNLIFAGTGNGINQSDSTYYSISYTVRKCKFAKSLTECIQWTPTNCIVEENYFGYALG